MTGAVWPVCREAVEHGTGRRPAQCGEPAEFVLWGQLFPVAVRGPRCRAHAVLHTHRSMPAQANEWALVDLRPMLRVQRRLEELAEAGRCGCAYSGEGPQRECWTHGDDWTRELALVVGYIRDGEPMQRTGGAE